MKVIPGSPGQGVVNLEIITLSEASQRKINIMITLSFRVGEDKLVVGIIE